VIDLREPRQRARQADRVDLLVGLLGVALDLEGDDRGAPFIADLVCVVLSEGRFDPLDRGLGARRRSTSRTAEVNAGADARSLPSRDWTSTCSPARSRKPAASMTSSAEREPAEDGDLSMARSKSLLHKAWRPG